MAEGAQEDNAGAGNAALSQCAREGKGGHCPLPKEVISSAAARSPGATFAAAYNPASAPPPLPRTSMNGRAAGGGRARGRSHSPRSRAEPG